MGSAPYEAHLFALHSLRPLQGRFLSPVLDEWLDLEIHPTEQGLRVSFKLVRFPAAA